MLSFRTRLGYALSLTVTVVLLCWWYMAWFQQPWGSLDDAAGSLNTGRGACREELADVREALALPDIFEYSKRTIRAKPVKRWKQQSVVRRAQKLIPDLEHMNIEDPDCRLPSDEAPLDIEYSSKPPPRVDTSKLMIGASTTLSRLKGALPQMSRWLSNTSTPLIVNILDSSDTDLFGEVQDLAHALAINCTLVPNVDHGPEDEDRHAHRHFSIVKILHAHKSASTKWFAVIDDDTFFPSLANLLAALEPFDPEREWYLGALSEDWNTIKNRFGFMAYGGAGILLSHPLLETLHRNFDDCLAPGGLEGDRLYRDCVFLHTAPPVTMTILPGLNQMDLLGDVSGWYQSRLTSRLLSLHHFNEWHHYPIQHGHLVSDICGSGPGKCFLQRYAFADEALMTNGYSVVEYPNGISFDDLDRVEGTFPHNVGQFDFSLGRLRDVVDVKIVWRLEFAVKEGDGRVRQFYVRRGAGDERAGDEDRLKMEVTGVFEVEWQAVR
ncbi:Hypothetical predicted protein [Lecanosticta acicola]|uniref:Glycosyltransferase family 31 protein n=1 Tax=Lecanosticta acicola TaxID=111012 RepID=A0AAI8YRE1_9PEZI|nr:Hypothetical predicted protein [Lecanosticta acicola]